MKRLVAFTIPTTLSIFAAALPAFAHISVTFHTLITTQVIVRATTQSVTTINMPIVPPGTGGTPIPPTGGGGPPAPPNPPDLVNRLETPRTTLPLSQDCPLFPSGRLVRIQAALGAATGVMEAERDAGTMVCRDVLASVALISSQDFSASTEAEALPVMTDGDAPGSHLALAAPNRKADNWHGAANAFAPSLVSPDVVALSEAYLELVRTGNFAQDLERVEPRVLTCPESLPPSANAPGGSEDRP